MELNMTNSLHCIAKKHDGYWSARCLDFSIYAVGDTLDEAKQKLFSEIDEYLFDAIEGDERDNAAYLLLRKAESREWFLFYTLAFLDRCHALKNWIGEAFSPAMPHGPFNHRSA